MEGVEDIPGTALHEGIQWDWESFPEYLDALERMPACSDVGAMVPHAALRTYVMGEREHGDANADDVETMTAILRASMEAGALGFSTGRTHGHRSVHGEPVPGTFAAVDQLDVLSQTMDAAGRGVFQVVPTGIGGIEGGDPDGAMDTELQWMLDLAATTRNAPDLPGDGEQRRPRQLAPVVRGGAPRERAGGNLRPQVADRCFGVLLGHQSRMNPFKYSPVYETLADLPLTERVARLRRREVRDAILADVRETNRASTTLDRIPDALFANLFPLGDELRVRAHAGAERRCDRRARRTRSVGAHVRPAARRRRSRVPARLSNTNVQPTKKKRIGLFGDLDHA